jgi:hypothetical protein
MMGTKYFLIKPKASLFRLLDKGNKMQQCLRLETIVSVQLTDRHGFDFAKIFDQLMLIYMEAAKQKMHAIDTANGFDFYWSFEPYIGRVTTCESLLRSIGRVSASNEHEELDYLIETNVND